MRAIDSILAGVALAALVACGHSKPSEVGPGPSEPAGGSGGETGEGGDASSSGAGTGDVEVAEDWTCGGELVPPYGGYLHETVFMAADQPGAVAAVAQEAQRQLVAKVCGSGGCPSIRHRFTTWKTGRGATRVCSMATVKRSEVEAWRKQSFSTETLNQQLELAARQLLGEDKKQPLALIWRVVDGGVAGGDRARWLVPRMRRALQKAGGMIVDAPPGEWDGRSIPKGLDLVITATLVAREENQIPVLEMVAEARFKVRRGIIARRATDPIVFPASVAPHVPDVLPEPPDSDPGIGVWLDTTSGGGGGLCAGDKTQVWINAESDLHVRVFDLYGKDGAMLIYPNPDRPGGRVKANTKTALGGEGGFQAVPVDSDAERFLVIAAKNKADLGPFEKLSGYCRLSPAKARQLHRYQGLPPKARIAHTGFRVFKGGSCEPLPSTMRAELTKQLEQVPLCP